MRYVRNIICFLVIAFVGCIVFINTFGGDAYIKEWILAELSKNGINAEIDSLEFDLPRSVVIKNISIHDSSYGLVQAETLTFKAPLLKLIFGRLSAGTFHVEGLTAENPVLAILPNDLEVYLSWDKEQSTLEGEIEVLKSNNARYPYELLDKGLFKLYASNPSTYSLEYFFDGMQFQNYTADDISGQADWDAEHREIRFSTTAEKSRFPLLTNAALFAKGINCSGYWNVDEREGAVRILANKIKDKSSEAPSSLFYARGLMVSAGWDAKDQVGRFSFNVHQIDDAGFFFPGSTFGVHEFAGLGGWNEKQIVHYSLSIDEITHKGSLNPGSPIVSNGLTGHGGWDLNHQSGNVLLGVDEILEEHFSMVNATLDLSTDGSPYYWKYALFSEGIYEDSFAVALGGSMAIGEDLCRFEINKFDGTLAKHTLNLAKPLKCLIYSDLNFEVSQSHFIVDGKEFEVSGQGNQKTMDFALQIPKQSINQDALEESGIPAFVGELSGSLLVRGPYTGLEGKLSLALENLNADHSLFDENSQFAVYLTADLSQDKITLNGRLADHTAGVLELQGVCPVDKSGYFLIEPSKSKEMYVNLDGDIDIARFHSLVPPSVWAGGRIAVDVRLMGLFQSLELYGNVKLVDGSFEQWKTGTILQHINADLDLHNDKVILHSFNAYDAQRGNVTAIGELDLISALDYPFHVDITVNQASITDIDDMQAVLSGSMSFVGNAKGALLQGELLTDRLDFTLNDDPSSIDHEIEVDYVNQSDFELPPTQPAKAAVKWPVCFDLHVQNRENILIHSEDFLSEWKGDVRVTGCNTQPILNGDFRILNGSFSLPDYLFPGKKFNITQGTISFAGELNKKTTLYIVGEMEIEHIVAQVIVKGSLSNPSLAFRSNPPMSQREILSWILFGRGMGDITPYQGAELTQSINQIKRSRSTSGKKNPTFLNSLTRLKENLGIDRIGIDRKSGKDGKEEVSLEVGKYILPEVFLGLKRNMSSEVNCIGLEANLRKNLKLQAEVGDDTDGQLHLKWKHDY